MARAKAAWESSHYKGLNLAKKAVDGSRSSNGVLKQCSQTKLQADPWWVVDLGASYAVKNVIITNRGDCCCTYKETNITLICHTCTCTCNFHQ